MVLAAVVVTGGLLAAGVIKLNGGGSSSSSAKFAVTFSESGLGLGAIWTVSLGSTPVSSGSSTIVFNLQNGTYSFAVNSSAGAPSPASGTVTVAGAAVAVPIAFTPVYQVLFSETGLPTGTSWTVTLGGVPISLAASPIAFGEPNGSYPFTVAATGYSASPASGTIVVRGADVRQSVVFTGPPVYPIAFTESGLPGGTLWAVTLAGVARDSYNSTVSFSEPNGSYSFDVGAVTGYSISPSSGTLSVTGRPVSQPVAFTPTRSTYTVTFTESGLGLGASWTVIFNSTTQPSSSATISFSGIPNGNLPFSVSASGYTATPSSGTITVSGASVNQPILFTNSGGGGAGETSGPAEAAAVSASSGYSGGGWHAAGAYAFALPAAASLPPQLVANFTSGCTSTTWIGGEPSSINIPATATSAAAGASAAWLILLSQSSTGSLLFVGVFSGSPTLLLYGTGGACAFYTGITTNGTIDSAQAASVANANGGATFLASYPGASRAYVGVGSYLPYLYAEWLVGYTTCGITQSSGTGYLFNATVNGTNGQLVNSHSGVESCTPIASAAGPALLAAFPSPASSPNVSLGVSSVSVSSRRP